MGNFFFSDHCVFMDRLICFCDQKYAINSLNQLNNLIFRETKQKKSVILVHCLFNTLSTIRLKLIDFIC